MSKVLLVILCTIALNACQKDIRKQDTPEIKAEINTILNNWHKNAANTNFNNYFNVMDSTSVFVGTDASENWSKKEFMTFCKPYFDKGQAWDFKPLERNIYISKSAKVVWFNEILDTWMGICRGSGVLEQSENKWKIKQYILSVTIPNNCTKEVVKIKSSHDSLFMKKFK